jgi:phospholipid/cholesterol/gamma-HCH transport system substrate-binding protein
MKSAIQKHLRDFIAIIVLVLIASLVALYVLAHQRTTIPGWVPVFGREVFVLKG